MKNISRQGLNWSTEQKLYTMHPAGEIRYGVTADYIHIYEQYVFNSFHYNINLGNRLVQVRQGVINENNRICR